MNKKYTLHLGDCLESLRAMADSSVDSIVTDPPYGLSFMGKRWDYDVPATEVWAECLRVLKPGGHLLAFAGTRTQHRMAVRIEDAGFEIRDMIAWVYGSGFPKSLDVSKAIDKARDDSADGLRVGAWLRAQREARGLKQKEVAALWPSASGGLTGCVANWETLGKVPKWDQWLRLKEFIGFSDEMDAEVWRLNGRKGTPGNERQDREVSGPAGNDVFQPTQRVINPGTPVLDAARQWQGWGTALKPALEPITVARKPLIGTVAANVLAHGTGALNIDGCRVSVSADDDIHAKNPSTKGGFGHAGASVYGDSAGAPAYDPAAGRWPANLIHDGSDEVVALFPITSSGSVKSGTRDNGKAAGCLGEFGGRDMPGIEGSTGSAARFFYCAKASRKDRHEGLDDPGAQFKRGTTLRKVENTATGGNNHPTVKPTDLMAYLCRLVTPPGGVVLDPFMGSGSTGKAAVREGFRFIGCELSPVYLAIAEDRVANELNQPRQVELL
jgi:DNA modification methylase